MTKGNIYDRIICVSVKRPLKRFCLFFVPSRKWESYIHHFLCTTRPPVVLVKKRSDITTVRPRRYFLQDKILRTTSHSCQLSIKLERAVKELNERKKVFTSVTASHIWKFNIFFCDFYHIIVLFLSVFLIFPSFLSLVIFSVINELNIRRN